MPYVRWRRLVNILAVVRVYRCASCQAVYVKIGRRRYWLAGRRCCSWAPAGAERSA